MKLQDSCEFLEVETFVLLVHQLVRKHQFILTLGMSLIAFLHSISPHIKLLLEYLQRKKKSNIRKWIQNTQAKMWLGAAQIERSVRYLCF